MSRQARAEQAAPPLFTVDRAAFRAWGASTRQLIDADRVAGYVAATEDGTCRPGAVPGVFSYLLIFASMNDAVGRLIPDVEGLIGLHAGHTIALDRPLDIGSAVAVRSAPTGLRATRTGAVLAVDTAITAADGQDVGTHRSILFLRGGTPDYEDGFTAAEPEAPIGRSPDAELALDVPADLALRYDHASGDHAPIHVDADAARAAGLAGPILQGSCTMAMVAHMLAATAGRGSPDVQRLSVRFGQPVYPGARLAVRAWHGDSGVDAVAVDAGQNQVIRQQSVSFFGSR